MKVRSSLFDVGSTMSEAEKKGSPWPWILVPVAAVSLFFVLRQCRQSLPPAESVEPAATVPTPADAPAPASPAPAEQQAAPATTPTPQ
jgi:hypothetical protein